MPQSALAAIDAPLSVLLILSDACLRRLFWGGEFSYSWLSDTLALRAPGIWFKNDFNETKRVDHTVW